MNVLFGHLLAITCAYLLDRKFGDPHASWHPVVIMGNIIAASEKKCNKGKGLRGKGAIAVLLPAILLFVAFLFIILFSYQLHFLLGAVLEALLLWLLVGGTSMTNIVEQIYQSLLTKNIEKARQGTAMIVSRNTDHASEEDIVKAVLESLGENISDSVTAPFFYAFIGGAPLAAFYRFINTADAMIGYRTERYRQYGWAAARTDDLLNLIPARVTALLMTLSARRVKKVSWKKALAVMWKDARQHDSPNAGFGESAMAGILDVQLGGPTVYHGKIKPRPFLGNGTRSLDAACMKDGLIVWQSTILRAVTVLWLIGGLLYVLF
ncbi:adenosylcobinamide-phosphate synthase CbiB [Bacillus piscicola]|uniref:adenosylcobinamide-phosphate synthase CbiB n=1 Tax=Bacillus piscicola TaxID=1632684 RepID=UPI001F08E256|nr:adenosylcobinamide-phosphate synthase CbiB [Bacillus piscicola]